jgi:hypothetical protein
VPVDFGKVEAESDPTAWADVGREVVALGLGFGEGGVFTGENFAGDGDDAVTVVIVEEVGESSFADLERGVGAAEFARGFGES